MRCFRWPCLNFITEITRFTYCSKINTSYLSWWEWTYQSEGGGGGESTKDDWCRKGLSYIPVNSSLALSVIPVISLFPKPKHTCWKASKNSSNGNLRSLAWGVVCWFISRDYNGKNHFLSSIEVSGALKGTKISSDPHHDFICRFVGLLDHAN